MTCEHAFTQTVTVGWTRYVRCRDCGSEFFDIEVNDGCHLPNRVPPEILPGCRVEGVLPHAAQDSRRGRPESRRLQTGDASARIQGEGSPRRGHPLLTSI
jgi:hypothetical protein